MCARNINPNAIRNKHCNLDATPSQRMPPPHSHICPDGRKSMDIPPPEKCIAMTLTFEALTSDLENLFSNAHSHGEYFVPSFINILYTKYGDVSRHAE